MGVVCLDPDYSLRDLVPLEKFWHFGAHNGGRPSSPIIIKLACL